MFFSRVLRSLKIMRLVVLAVLTAVAVVLPSCEGKQSPGSSSRPNLILISIDTLRADHVHGYGYQKPTTPFIDSLMDKGTSFLNCISPAPWTLPAHLSIFTSLYPHSHGVVGQWFALSDDVPTFPPILQKMRYKTAAFTTVPYMSPRYGFGRGFDVYICNEVPAPAVCQEALQWLQQVSSDKFFLFLHYFDVHSDYTPSPYFLEMFESNYTGTLDGTADTLYKIRNGEIVPTKEDTEHLIALYDAEIRQLDSALATFFHALEQRRLLNNTVIIITADHGEEFLDHGNVMHGRTLYDEIIKVPLIIVGPGLPAGKVVHNQVGLVDLLPTILDLCDARSPRGIQGRSLVPLLKGNDAEWTQATFAEADHKNEKPDIKRAVRTDRYKLYLDTLSGKEELYDVIADPGEKTNIVEKEPAIAADLREQLNGWMNTKKATPGRITLTDKEQQKLRSLGYLK